MSNPVLIRELRGRWRRPVTYIILFAYSAILALLMGLIYSASAAGVNLATDDASSVLGRKLFAGFLSLQTGVWTLLAAALTAPAIAGERERGLLQGVLLSPVTPGAIVRGKLISSLWFIVLLLLVPMPIISLCFSLGGLSPSEFIVSFLLLGGTAFSGACLGLAASACNRRSDAALMTTFAVTLTLCWPSVLVALTFEKNYFIAGAVLCLIYQAILTAAAIGIASDALNSVLPERESEYAHNSQSLRDAAFGAPDSTINSIILGREEDLSYDRATLYTSQTPPVILNPVPQTSTRSTIKPRKIWRDTPLSRLIHFRNPVMQREVRARLRRREAESLMEHYDDNGIAFITGVIATSLFFGLLGFSLGIRTSLGIWWICGAMTVSAVVGALTFVREREQNTLQPLLLTLLSPAEVLIGKWGAACFAGTYYSAAFLPLALLGTISHWMLPFLVLLLGMAAIWCGAAIGLAFSWICRQAGVAVACSSTTVFLLLAISYKVASYYLRSYTSMPLAFGRAQLGVDSSSALYPPFYYFALPLALTWLVCGAVALIFVLLRLRPQSLERNSTSLWSRDLTKEYSR